MTERTYVEYDLAEIIKESVDAISAKLAEMGPADLVTLDVMEGEAISPRKTLRAAIKAEMAARDEEARAEQPVPVADQAGEVAEPAAQGVGGATLLDMKDSHIEQLTRENQALTEENTRLRGEVEELLAQLPMPDAPGGGEVLVPIAEGLVARAALDRVVFADPDGRMIDSLPSLMFRPHDFELIDNTLVLNKPISFPVAAPLATVKAAWLIGPDGPEGLCAALVSPLVVSGGRQAEIPAGFLSFAA